MKETVYENGRMIPVVRDTDVLVCGGGPAGIAAAFTAARCGAKATILERHPFLGGVWTAGALTILLDAERKGGFAQELRERLAGRGASTPWFDRPDWPVYTLEAMKFLLDDLVDQTGVDVQLYTQVADVHRNGPIMDGVYTESKSGREFVRAKIVIDATGDGDVAARAGCPFEIGRPGDGKMQPMTLYGRIGGYRGGPVHIEPLLSIARKAGLEPSYERITLFPQPGQSGVFMLMATHLYGDGTNARDLTRAEFNGRREIRELVHVLRRDAGPDWEDVYLIDTGPFVGVRETRRILGRYYLTGQDVANGRLFDDGICRVGFAPDIHHPDPGEGRGLINGAFKPYDIPYRCLLARDIDNLLLAGRCISGDHMAFASFRVTGDAVAMGEAAGLASALALRDGIHPCDVDAGELVARLGYIRSHAYQDNPWPDAMNVPTGKKEAAANA